MTRSAQEFDQLLSAVLKQAEAGDTSSAEGSRMPAEVAGDDLQLLKVALEIRRQFAPEGPDDDFVRTSEIRLLNQLKAKARQASQASPRRARWQVPIWRQLLKPVPVIASLLLVVALTLGSVGVAGASAASLPGDALYPVKRGLERARLAVSFSSKGDAQLLAAFAMERVEEIEELSSLDRLEDMDQAVEGYLEISGQLADLSEDPVLELDEYQEGLANNIQVLERVLLQVPPEAQPAIQRAIDRSKEKAEAAGLDKEGEGVGKPTTGPSDKGQDQEQRQQERQTEQNLRTAEQIAGKYEGVEAGDVMGVFEGECEGDWQCVRNHFREQEQNQNNPQEAQGATTQDQRRAGQIARQYDVSTEDVLVQFDICGQDWKCVRDYYREK